MWLNGSNDCERVVWNRCLEGAFDVLFVIFRNTVLVMLYSIVVGVVFGFVEVILPLLDSGSVPKGIQVSFCQ